MTMRERIATAMLADLRRQPKDGGNHGGLIGGSGELDSIIIRGHVDLLSLADAAIRALGECAPATHKTDSDGFGYVDPPWSRDT